MIYLLNPDQMILILISALKKAVINGKLNAIIHYPIGYIEDPHNSNWVQHPNADEGYSVFKDEEHGILEVHFKQLDGKIQPL